MARPPPFTFALFLAFDAAPRNRGWLASKLQQLFYELLRARICCSIQASSSAFLSSSLATLPTGTTTRYLPYSPTEVLHRSWLTPTLSKPKATSCLLRRTSRPLRKSHARKSTTNPQLTRVDDTVRSSVKPSPQTPPTTSSTRTDPAHTLRSSNGKRLSKMPTRRRRSSRTGAKAGDAREQPCTAPAI